MVPNKPPTQVNVRVNLSDIWPNWRSNRDICVKGVLYENTLHTMNKQNGMFPGHDGHVPGCEHA